MIRWSEKYFEAENYIREKKPLVHHITNYVVMNVTANVTLAMGASPVMAHDSQEVEEMVSFASAFVINIGTLSPHWVEAMLKAGKKARELDVPVILDPVGAGATRLRTDVCSQIMSEVRPDIVRGNQAEIVTLAGGAAAIQGVDSLEAGEAPIGLFKEFARTADAVVCVTGPVDWVTDGHRVLRIENGHPMMSNVTGTGCSASAAVAVFNCSPADRLESSALGLAAFGACGEVAAKNSVGPGSFQVAILDALYNAPTLDLGAELRISEVQ